MTTPAARAEASVKLAFPITHAGKTVDTLIVRRPKVADMLDVQAQGGGVAEIELAMVARLTGLSAGQVRELDMKDYAAIQAVLRDFTS